MAHYRPGYPNPDPEAAHAAAQAMKSPASYSHRRRSMSAIGLCEAVEVAELADRCAHLEEEIRNGGGNSGAGGMGAQARLDSLRAGMRLLLSCRFADGDDFFRSEGEDEAGQFRAIREGCRKIEVDKRQLVL